MRVPAASKESHDIRCRSRRRSAVWRSPFRSSCSHASLDRGHRSEPRRGRTCPCGTKRAWSGRQPHHPRRVDDLYDQPRFRTGFLVPRYSRCVAGNHDGYSHTPAYSALEIYGAEPTPTLLAALTKYRLTDVVAFPGGFRASTPDGQPAASPNDA